MAMIVNCSESVRYKDSFAVSKDVMDELNIEPERKYILRFGQCTTLVRPVLSKGDALSSVSIGSKILEELGIPEDIKTGIKISGGEIALGPVLGMFVGPRYFQRLLRQSPPKSCSYLVDANRSAKLFVYFFTFRGADWANNRIEGCYYSEHKKSWVRCLLPLPDVVYDRCVNFNRSDLPIVNHYRKHFSPSGFIKRVNSRDSLDKYWLYERLKLYPEIKQYLPETICYRRSHDVFQMLNKYKTIYLKSFYGSKGSEVMTITEGPQSYKCIYFESNKLTVKNFRNRVNLIEQINSFFKDKEFIIQQGINLIKYGGSCVDMRVLIQKDGSGKWKCIYNAVHIGKDDSPIVAGEEKGSVPYNFKDIMPLILHLPDYRIEELFERIKRICIQIAEIIEKEYGSFGEIGMDMALDDALRIWYIEANSKPDRELQSGPLGDARLAACCHNTIEYVKYMSGFTW